LKIKSCFIFSITIEKYISQKFRQRDIEMPLSMVQLISMIQERNEKLADCQASLLYDSELAEQAHIAIETFGPFETVGTIGPEFAAPVIDSVTKTIDYTSLFIGIGIGFGLGVATVYLLRRRRASTSDTE
jgi:hypothetical protein